MYVRASGRSPTEAARWCARCGSEGAGAASPRPAKNVWLATDVDVDKDVDVDQPTGRIRTGADAVMVAVVGRGGE